MIGRVVEQVVLVAAGLVLAVVGSGSAFAPAAFYAPYGIDATDPALLNELRATGVALLLLGIGVVVGAFVRRLTFAVAVVAALVLLGYAIGRALSWAVDGTPPVSVLAAGAVELVLGIAALWVAVRTRSALRAEPTN